MTESDTVVECPEHTCAIVWTDIEALEAHLQWDHNRRESKAARFAYEAFQEQAENKNESDN